MTESEKAFYALAGWLVCVDCGNPHHPDDVNPDYYRPGALCYGCSKSVMAQGAFCKAWCRNTRDALAGQAWP